MPKKPWYSKGIKWKCQGSGKCCVSRGQYGYVYMDFEDRKRMAKELKLSLNKFTDEYCQVSGGYYHLKVAENEECLFLKDNKCSIYNGRPMQCRTWPFWPENMSAKNWKRDVAAFCPGVGKGSKVYSLEEIEKQLDAQVQSELLMDEEPI